MAEGKEAPAGPKAKPTKPKQPTKPVSHPKYEQMVISAIQSLQERRGSSRQAILKYILANFDLGTDQKPVNSRLKLALKKGVATGQLEQVNGTGATGRFRVFEKEEAEDSMGARKSGGSKAKRSGRKKAKVVKMWLPKGNPRRVKPSEENMPKVDSKTNTKAVKGSTKPKAVAKKSEAGKPKTPKKAAQKKATKA